MRNRSIRSQASSLALGITSVEQIGRSSHRRQLVTARRHRGVSSDTTSQRHSSARGRRGNTGGSEVGWCNKQPALHSLPASAATKYAPCDDIYCINSHCTNVRRKPSSHMRFGSTSLVGFDRSVRRFQALACACSVRTLAVTDRCRQQTARETREKDDGWLLMVCWTKQKTRYPHPMRV